MKSGLLLDIIIGKRTTIFQLLAGKDQTLLIWRNAFFVLDLGLDIIDRVRSFDIQGDGLTSQSLHKDLHASAEAQDEMKSGLLLDIIIGKRTTIFQLLAGKDQTLLIWRNAFFVLDLGLDIIDCVRSFDIQGDGLTSQSLHKDLHASAEAQDEMKSGLLLDIIIGKRTTIFQLLA